MALLVALVCVSALSSAAFGLLSWKATETAARHVQAAVWNFITDIRSHAHMQTIETVVQDTQGNTHTIKTTRNAGETVEAWQARHMEAVDHAKTL